MRRFYKKSMLCAALLSAMLLSTGCDYFSNTEVNKTAPIAETVDEVYFSEFEAGKGDIKSEFSTILNYKGSQASTLYFEQDKVYVSNTYVEVGDIVKKGDLLTECQSKTLTIQLEEYTAKTGELEDLATYYSSLVDIETRKKHTCAAYGLQFDSTKLDEYTKASEENTKALNIAKMQLEETKEKLENCRLYANIDGVVSYIAPVSKKNALDSKTAAVIIKNEDPSLSVVTNRIELLNVEEEYDVVVHHVVKKNNKFDQNPEDAIPDDHIKVKCISMETSNVSGGTFNVAFEPVSDLSEIKEIKNCNFELVITLDSAENVILVPRESLIKTDSGYCVYIQSSDGTRALKSIKVGILTDEYAEVKSGLNVGESIIYSPKTSK